MKKNKERERVSDRERERKRKREGETEKRETKSKTKIFCSIPQRKYWSFVGLLIPIYYMDNMH